MGQRILQRPGGTTLTCIAAKRKCHLMRRVPYHSSFHFCASLHASCMPRRDHCNRCASLIRIARCSQRGALMLRNTRRHVRSARMRSPADVPSALN